MASDLQSYSSKRRKVAFGEDVEVPSANKLFTAWTTWRDRSAGVVSVFLTSDEKGVMATKYHTRLIISGLDIKGVDAILKCVASALDAPTWLLYLGLYE